MAWFVLSFFLLAAPAPWAQREGWFTEIVHWEHGDEALPWERIGTLPGAGDAPYRVALQPLWAVEGGILAFEIIVAKPEEPFENLLGEREMDVPQPFVISLEELESAFRSSEFGAIRILQLPAPAAGSLRVSVQDWKLGRGVGACDTCTNIQELMATVEIDAK